MVYIHYLGFKMITQKRKTSCYCINSRRLSNLITNKYDKHLQEINLTVNQYSLLVNINQLEICSVSDLAIYVGLERTTLVRTLKPLFDKKLIEDISETTQRNRQIKITQKGKEVLEKGKPLWKQAQKEIEDKIGKDNILVLSEILSKLID